MREQRLEIWHCNAVRTCSRIFSESFCHLSRRLVSKLLLSPILFCNLVCSKTRNFYFMFNISRKILHYRPVCRHAVHTAVYCGQKGRDYRSHGTLNFFNKPDDLNIPSGLFGGLIIVLACFICYRALQCLFNEILIFLV